MSRTCEYCGGPLNESDLLCPNCGAPNEQASPDAIPRTIPELQGFCASHNLPLEQMRFFLGRDYRGPRAFGIYQDAGGDFVVYKNKSDGTRAVRYQGPDEAFAVRELYERMKQELINQRRRAAEARRRQDAMESRPREPDQEERGFLSWLTNFLRKPIAWVLVCLAVFGIRNGLKQESQNGYYLYNNDYYYSQGDDWYLYDTDYFAWMPVEADQELSDHPQDYFQSSGYSYAYGTTDFSDSYYYDPYDSGSGYSSGGDYDSDYDYDYDSWDDDSDWDWDSGDSWDSDYTDWDSDW